jgi:hypothetical protein
MSDGRTTYEGLEQLVRRILATQDDEIDCEQVADVIARYVELEVAGQGAPRVLPKVHQHLVQCNACCEIRDVLYQLVIMEEAGALADSVDLLDEIVTSASLYSGRSAEAPVSRRMRDQFEEPPERQRVPGLGRRPQAFRLSQVSDQAGGEAQWVRWAVVILVIALIVLLGVWVLQNGAPLSKLNESVGLAAIAYCANIDF